MKKFIATNCEFMLHEDDWFEGEGKLISSWVEDLGEADTIAELLGHVQYLDKCHGRCERIQKVFEHDPCYEDETGRFDADLTVDIEDSAHHDGGFRIVKPTEEKWDEFQKGKAKLYALHVCVHIVKTSSLDIDDVCNEGWQR